jgi:uroporphyrinogen decarboxylase
MMTKEERALNVITGKPVDYLPSQITIADRSKDAQIAKGLGLANAGDLDSFLENHINISLTLHDTALFYRNDPVTMQSLEDKGYVKVDRKNGIVYDSWGMGIKIGEDGFFACYHPLQGNKEKNRMAEPFLPESFDRKLLDMDFAEAVRQYQAPDPFKEGNFSALENDLKTMSGKSLVIPSGYLGIYERAYSIMGFEQFMMESLSDPESVEILMDKITEFKIIEAKQKVKMGFKVGHHGDDLGAQFGSLVSPDQFRTMIKPRIARLFKVFKDAGVPMVMHSCGNITEFIPDLIEIGLDMLEPVQPCMDLAYLKREFGKDLSFWGGIDTQDILPHGSPDDVRKETRNVIHTLGKGGRYVIAPAQEVMVDVPIANIVAMLETIKQERDFNCR